MALRLRVPALVAVCLVLLCLSLLPSSVRAVDRNKFRSCRHSDFCGRLRDNGPSKQAANYQADTSALAFDASTSTLTVPLTSGLWPLQPALDARVAILNDGLVRLTVRETGTPLFPRHAIQDVVQAEAVRPYSGAVDFAVTNSGATAKWSLTGRDGSKDEAVLTVTLAPFTLSFTVGGTQVMSVNSANLMAFEQFRPRNANTASTPPVAPHAPVGMESFTEEQQKEAQEMYALQQEQYATELAAHEASLKPAVWPVDTPNSWSESFNGHTDTKLKGPSAVGLDVSFHGSNHVYGIPEHASSFALKNTVAGGGGYEEPFRLFNLDVFEYELDEPMALYGAVPWVVAHTADGARTSGMLWLNAAESYVDVSDVSGGGLFSSNQGKRVHFMSETGLLDAFFVLGPKPQDVFYTYSSLTGFPFLPPMFSIAYHQCRWNYKSQDDVLAVDRGFDEHDMPYDVLWLDIEHTDAKKYFTWDKNSFATPKEMQKTLSDKGRRMVNIVDPHIKRDASYHVHQQATSLGHYIKKADGSDYDGWCWPGSSSYLDFFQSAVRKFWSDQFSYANYDGSTPSLFIWNDMNEPSVFNGPEVSMPKDNLHTLDGIAEKVEHRDVHNLYGMHVTAATVQGLVERDQHRQRPFVLTRSFFAGSQRTAAVWTGDNMAKWDHLKASQPMLLSMAVSQIPFSGADVGGFFGDPDAQLLTRWYQAGAYQPFFRGHSHIDTKRREPWVFGEPYTGIIRAALRARYANLPFLYTLFYQNHVSGMPIMRPLWVEFPSDPKTYGSENTFLLGSALLVHPVVDPDQTTQLVYLPATAGSGDVWVDLQNDAVHAGGDSVNVLTPLQHIPVFQRGGSIIAKRERARRCSTLMQHDPYTLVVALSSQKTAAGQLFVDDSNSFEYQTGKFIYMEFSLTADGLLSGRQTNAASTFVDQNTIERIVLIGGASFTRATLVSGTDAHGAVVTNVPLTLQSTNAGKRLILRKPDIRIGSDFQIQLQ